MNRRGHRFDLFGCWFHHQGPICYGGNLNGLLQKAPEQKSSKLGMASIKAKRKFVQVTLKMVSFNRPLMRAHQPTLDQTADSVNARQSNMRFDIGAFDNARRMDVVASNRRRVRRPSVGNDYRSWFDIILQKGAQCRSLSIRDYAKPTPSKSSGLEYFNRYGNKHFSSGASTPQTFFGAADQSLVNLNLPSKSFSPLSDHCFTETMQNGPSRLVRAELQESMQCFCGDTILSRCNVPCRCEPQRERRSRAMKDCSSNYRSPRSAKRTIESTIAQFPPSKLATFWAYEPLGPTEPLQVVETRIVVGEPCQHFPVAARIISTSFKTGSYL